MDPLDENIKKLVFITFDIILVIIFCCSTVANSIVLIVFYRKSGLRTISNRFVINLTIINIISCLSLVPVSLTDLNLTISNNVPSSVLCFLSEFFFVACSTVIVFSVLLIAIDQYFAVVDPLRYHTIVDSVKAYVMIASTWVLAIILGLFGAVDPFEGVVHSTLFQSCCNASGKFVNYEGYNSSEALHVITSNEDNGLQSSIHLSDIYRIVFTLLYFVVVLLIPFLLICIIYYRICAAASGNSRRTRQNGSGLLTNDDSNHEYFSVPLIEEKLNELKKEEPKPAFMIGDCEHEEESENADSFVNKPSLVLTRPSPPRALSKEEMNCEKCQNPEYLVITSCKCKQNIQNMRNSMKSNVSLPNLELVKTQDVELSLLKPTIKNSHFSKLSSAHIQFSKSIEKLDEIGIRNERRHSNVPINIEQKSKDRSPSIQSTELPTNLKSSRSSSLHSNSSRRPISRASSIRSTSSFLVNSLRHRISNASLFKYREEARAARISALVIVMGLVCWFPYFVVFFLHSLVNFHRDYTLTLIPRHVNTVSIVLLLLSTISSPCLFAFRNRKIKKEIRKIFKLNHNDLNDNNKKSFYSKHFSINLKNQTLQILFGLKHKEPGTPEKVNLQSLA